MAESIGFYEQYFADEQSEPSMSGEVAVKCPFTHFNRGTIYKEHHASASYNTQNRLYHCHSCGAGLTEVGFRAKLADMSEYQVRLLNAEKNMTAVESGAWDDWEKKEQAYVRQGHPLSHQGIYPELTDKLHIGFDEDTQRILIPVIINGDVVAVRKYKPNGKPKMLAESGDKAHVLPFDMWDRKTTTLLCAGEKDAMIARQHGFNAITFTGGEGSYPEAYEPFFKDGDFIVAYDNDDAGRRNARAVANRLKEAGASRVRILEAHHEVCTEKGGDIHDFFWKYHKSAKDLKLLIDAASELTADELLALELKDVYTPERALDELPRKEIKMVFTVVTASESSYQIPMVLNEIDKATHQVRSTWTLKRSNVEIIAQMVRVASEQLHGIYKQLVRPASSSYIGKRSERSVYIYRVSTGGNELYTLISMERLEQSKSYLISCKIGKMRAEKDRTVFVAWKARQYGNLDDFRVTDEVIDSLNQFHRGSVDASMAFNLEQLRIRFGYDFDEHLVHLSDMAFHSAREIRVIQRNPLHGTLDVFLLGESRSGKSDTQNHLLKLYGMGEKASYKSSTVAGLIGGSQKGIGGDMHTVMGVLPRNHEKIVVMEEFSGATDAGLIQKMTEARSSREVRLSRVGEHTVFPMNTRMITTSNTRAGHGMNGNRKISSYQSGVEPLNELIENAEDLARYDMFVLVDSPKQDDPTGNTGRNTALLDDIHFQNRIRWVWTRGVDQVKFTEGAHNAIIESSARLNRKFDSHFKLLGTEAWKKISRMAVAVAGICGNHDTNADLLVEEAHVKWVERFVESQYSSQLFRLDVFARRERELEQVDDSVIAEIQKYYRRTEFQPVFELMHNQAHVTRADMQNYMDTKSIPEFIQNMTRLRVLISRTGSRFDVTARYRKAYPRLEQQKTFLKKVSDQ